MSNGNPKRTLKPNVTAGTSIRGGLILAGAIVATGIFVLVSEVSPVLVVVGGLLLALTGIGGVFFNLNSREYRFYENEVEVYEGFINITQNNTSYDRVTDISYNQPVTQRLFGTGTIKLNTAGSAYHEIKISYVDEPEQEYERLKTVVKDEA